MRKFIVSGDEFVLDQEKNGLASLSHTVVGLNGYVNSIDEPASNGAKMALTVP